MAALAMTMPLSVVHAYSTSAERLRLDTEQNVRNRVTGLLDKYCGKACELIHINVGTEQYLDEDVELGFESLAEQAGRTAYVVRDIAIDIQVDDKVTATNRDRIQVILLNHLRAFGIEATVNWRPVRLPTVDQTSGAGEQLKLALERRLSQALNEVARAYCPDQCVVAQININATEVTPDEAATLSRAQIFRGQANADVIRIDDIAIAVEVDERLGEDAAQRIANIMRAKTRFASPVTIDVNVVAFPEPSQSRQRRLDAQSEDPFNLDKLRQMLMMFRELAGTKEIITNNSTTSTSNNSESSKVASTNNSSTSASERQMRSDVSTQTSAAGESVEWAVYIGAFILLAGLLVAVFLRVLAANRDAKVMVAEADGQGTTNGILAQLLRGRAAANNNDAGAPAASAPTAMLAPAQVSQRLRIDQLRSTLMSTLVEAPRVARDTFARMLREDGVELTAKYVHLLGQVVVFELIDDPDLKSKLVDLSEFYHRSSFVFTADEELALLQMLKTRFTASEIRVMTRKTNEQFDFLTKLTPQQIFQLVMDERPQVQSVVLLQLERSVRMQVYDLFRGQAKSQLLQELSKGDSVPREYLFSVAQAIARKAQTRPEFDAENLRGSDILLDLLQRSDLQEQRQLMANLMRTNPDTARGVKAKLITIETLNFLKDGLLIEVVLGMQRAELLTFLRGTRQHICNLLLNKAPRELAESWYEELQNLGAVDDAQYRSVEAKIVSRIQAMAAAGAISIVALNDIMFSTMTAKDGTNVSNAMPTTPPAPGYIAA